MLLTALVFMMAYETLRMVEYREDAILGPEIKSEEKLV
jgi:hypothetical protein